jgi:hypothetical protein
MAYIKSVSLEKPKGKQVTAMLTCNSATGVAAAAAAGADAAGALPAAAAGAEPKPKAGVEAAAGVAAAAEDAAAGVLAGAPPKLKPAAPTPTEGKRVAHCARKCEAAARCVTGPLRTEEQ